MGKKRKRQTATNQYIEVLVHIWACITLLCKHTEVAFRLFVGVVILGGFGFWLELVSRWIKSNSVGNVQTDGCHLWSSLAVLIPSIIGPAIFDLFEEMGEDDKLIRKHMMYGLLLCMVPLLIFSGILIWRVGSDPWLIGITYVLSLICWLSVNPQNVELVYKKTSAGALLPDVSKSNSPESVPRVVDIGGKKKQVTT